MPELPAPSDFAKLVATTAREQHDQFHLIDENDEPLSSQIKKYWQAVGQPFPGVEVPWSAVFVSFCVKKAGATDDEFEFAAAHSIFVHKAINNPAAYRGVKISAASVRVGDIIQNNRGGTSHDFEFAKTHPTYTSHSAVVVARGEDHLGKFALTIGGNESDSVRRVRVALKDDGTIRQRTGNPFICLLKNEK